MQGKTLGDLTEYLGGTLYGDPLATITGLGTLDSASASEISFLANPKYAAKVAASRALAVVAASETSCPNTIVVANPHLAYAKLLTLFTTRPRAVRGIMAGAHVGENFTAGCEVTIHPGAIIGDNVTIGERVTIYPNVTIYAGVTLGDDVVLHSGVAVREGCRIGSRVTIHNNAVIGADGFGYSPDGQKWYKVPQVGIVIIEDDVEIGAGTTVDRAAITTTRIGRGTKIDNLVQIAHNCQIGEDCVIVAQAGIAGSTKLGSHVTIGGQTAIVGHLTIGDNASVSGKSGVFADVAPGAIVSGTPAIPHQTRLRAAVIFPRLPEMHKTIKSLLKRVNKIDGQG